MYITEILKIKHMKKIILIAMIAIIALASCEKKEVVKYEPTQIKDVTLKYEVISSEKNIMYKYQDENGVICDWIDLTDSILYISFTCPFNSNFYLEAVVNPYTNYNTHITANLYVDGVLFKTEKKEKLNGFSKVILSGKLN